MPEMIVEGGCNDMIKALLELIGVHLTHGQLINFGVALLGIGATLTMLMQTQVR